MIVPLPITDDDKVQGKECTCLEIVPNCLDTYNLNPSISRTTICVEDNDGEQAWSCLDTYNLNPSISCTTIFVEDNDGE